MGRHVVILETRRSRRNNMPPRRTPFPNRTPFCISRSPQADGRITRRAHARTSSVEPLPQLSPARRVHSCKAACARLLLFQHGMLLRFFRPHLNPPYTLTMLLGSILYAGRPSNTPLVNKSCSGSDRQTSISRTERGKTYEVQENTEARNEACLG